MRLLVVSFELGLGFLLCFFFPLPVKGNVFVVVRKILFLRMAAKVSGKVSAWLTPTRFKYKTMLTVCN